MLFLIFYFFERLFLSSRCLERSRRHLGPSLWGQTVTQAMPLGSGLEGLARFLQKRTAQWANRRSIYEGFVDKIRALQSKMAAIHDMFDYACCPFLYRTEHHVNVKPELPCLLLTAVDWNVVLLSAFFSLDNSGHGYNKYP